MDLETPGVDTWLARLLHERGRLDLATLQAALGEVRARRAAGQPGATLAGALVARGLASRGEVAAALAELRAPPTAGPRRLGPYLIEGELGAGGMGVVYRARHDQTGARYALKTLLPGADPLLVERFRREGAAQAAVDAHPNVARVHSAGSEGNVLFLVTELIEGTSLDQRLRGGPLPPTDAAALVAALARGVAHLHAAGVQHRDLKPANVLIAPDGAPKLVDFGLAALVGEGTLTQTGDVLGTPAYMAPEQATGERQRIGPATDVYGLGALLYATLTGAAPFEGGSVLEVLRRVTQDAPRPPSHVQATVPAALDAVCLRALAKSPAERHASAAALADALEAALEAPPARPHRWPRWAAGLAVGAAALTLTAGLRLREPGSRGPPTTGRAPPTRAAGEGDGAAPKRTAGREREEVDPSSPAEAEAEGAAPASVAGLPSLAQVRAFDLQAWVEEHPVLAAAHRVQDGPATAYPPSMANLGAELLEGEDAPLAGLAWLLAAAEGDDRRSCRKIAERLSAGDGVRRDPALALAWYERALQLGEPGAALRLAVALLSVGGAERSARARLLLEDVADADVDWAKRAAAELVRLLLSGTPDLEPDPAAARRWLEVVVALAPEHVAATALLAPLEPLPTLAEVLAQPPPSDPAAYPEASAEFRELLGSTAERPSAAAEVGAALCGDAGAPQVAAAPLHAVRWFDRAGRLGFEAAWRRIGSIALEGRVVRRDARAAIASFERGWALGDVRCFRLLGEALLEVGGRAELARLAALCDEGEQHPRPGPRRAVPLLRARLSLRRVPGEEPELLRAWGLLDRVARRDPADAADAADAAAASARLEALRREVQPRRLPDGLERTARAGEYRWRSGPTLVYVPPGAFAVGDPGAPARHQRRVRLTRGFFLGKVEVTVAEVSAFLQAHPGAEPRELVPGPGDAARVSRTLARAYCEGLGLRLPTDAEWELAARSGDLRRFPWGDVAPTPAHGRLGPEGALTAQRGASPFGCLDMAGGVAEWVEDGHAPLRENFLVDPRLPAEGRPGTLRGGSTDGPAQQWTTWWRTPQDPTRAAGGIRVALDSLVDEHVPDLAGAAPAGGIRVALDSLEEPKPR